MDSIMRDTDVNGESRGKQPPSSASPNSDTPRQQLLARFWQQTVAGNIKDMQAVRSRLLLILSGFSILINLIYAAAAASTRQHAELAIFGVTLIILIGVFISAWRFGWRRPTAIIYIGSAVLSLSLFILLFPYVPAAVTAWLPFIPMLAMILLDPKDGVFATLLAILWLYAVTLYVQWQRTATPFMSVLQDNLATLAAFAVTTLAALAVLLVYVYIRDLLSEQQQRERQAKEALLRILCHDISGDLSIIRMSAMISGAPQHVDRLPGAMRNIRDATESIIEMVQTVRSMAALEAGKLSVRLQPVRVADTLKHCVERWQSRAQQKGVALIADIPDASLCVWADTVYFEQTVLGNLIGNAIKFTPPDKHIWLSAKVGRDPGTVEVRVLDEGMGIPDPLMAHLFDPGKHTNREGTAGEAGTGFGLPLVKQFVQHFGGDIQARSAGENAGSEFVVTLRRAEPGDT